MSPSLRRAFHRALDIILDAVEDEARQVKPKRGRRVVEPPPPAMPADVTPEELAAADRAWKRAGYRPRKSQ